MSGTEMFVNGLLMGGLLVVVLALAFSVFRVEEGHLGILTAFKGARRRKADGSLLTFKPGLHLKRPWDSVKQVSTMEQSLTLPEDGGGREAIAEDGTVLKLDAAMRYQPDEAALAQWVFGLAQPGPHLSHLFAALMRNELANVRAVDAERLGGSYAVIRRDRKALDRSLESACRQELDGRYGVKLRGVDVTDIHPPDELADALNAVIGAQTHADERYFRAEGESRQRLLAAKEGVEIARARARASEEEILILCNALGTLNERKTLVEYLRRRRAEALCESRALFFKQEEAK